MTLPEGEQPPASFEERLDAARLRQGLDARPGADAPAPGVGTSRSPMGVGLRVGIELVSALVVGVVIGWLLDRWLHTAPLFIAVFVLLGGAAGVVNVWRTMGPQAPGPR